MIDLATSKLQVHMPSLKRYMRSDPFGCYQSRFGDLTNLKPNSVIVYIGYVS